jgi:hypothetical protein
MMGRHRVKHQLALAGLALFMLAFVTPTHAHAFKSVYVRIVTDTPHTADIVLRSPLDANQRAAAVFLPAPEGCERSLLDVHKRDGYLLRHSRWDCDSALEGQDLALAGLSIATPDALIAARLSDGQEIMSAVNRDHSHFTFTPADSGPQALPTFFPAGLRHILSGWDHLLFLLGLLLLVQAREANAREALRLGLITVTAFTLAHSLTLAGAVFGLLWLPARAVEALIAGSILLLAVELSRKDAQGSLAIRWPWSLAFGFGLIHGFGFAGALLHMGLPAAHRGWALGFFNLGVELGQIAVLLCAWLFWRLLVRRPRVASLATHTAILTMGSISAYWLIKRSSAILLT